MTTPRKKPAPSDTTVPSRKREARPKGAGKKKRSSTPESAVAATLPDGPLVPYPDPDLELKRGATRGHKHDYISIMSRRYLGGDFYPVPHKDPRGCLLAYMEFITHALPSVVRYEIPEGLVRDHYLKIVDDCANTLGLVSSMNDDSCRLAWCFFRAGMITTNPIGEADFYESALSETQSKRGKQKKGKPNLQNRPLKDYVEKYIRETLEGNVPRRYWNRCISEILVAAMSREELPKVKIPTYPTIAEWIEDYELTKED